MAMLTKNHSMSEKVEQASEMEQLGVSEIRQNYTQAYRDAVFTIWYSANKPIIRQLQTMLPNPVEFGISSGYPSKNTLLNWVTDFREKATVLDEEVSRQMQQRMVAQKVQMLDAHADIGLEMQRMAMEYLHMHPEKMNPNAAVRLLVEGIGVERESRGIGKSVMQMVDRTDEELLKQINELLAYSPADNEEIPDEEDAL